MDNRSIVDHGVSHHSFRCQSENVILMRGSGGIEIGIDRTTGTHLWTVDLTNPIESGSPIQGERFPTDGQLLGVTADGSLFALDEGTGKVNWSVPTGIERVRWPVWPVVSSPLGAFVLGADGTLTAFDSRTGEPRWSRTLEHQSAQIFPSANDLFLSTYPSFSSIDPETGEDLWVADDMPVISTITRMLDDTALVAVDPGRGEIVALERERGKVIWRVTSEEAASAVMSWTVSDTYLVWVDRDRAIHAVAMDRATEAWSSRELRAAINYRQSSAPLATDGHLLFMSGDDRLLHILDLPSGEAQELDSTLGLGSIFGPPNLFHAYGALLIHHPYVSIRRFPGQ